MNTEFLRISRSTRFTGISRAENSLRYFRPETKESVIWEVRRPIILKLMVFAPFPKNLGGSVGSQTKVSRGFRGFAPSKVPWLGGVNH